MGKPKARENRLGKGLKSFFVEDDSEKKEEKGKEVLDQEQDAPIDSKQLIPSIEVPSSSLSLQQFSDSQQKNSEALPVGEATKSSGEVMLKMALIEPNRNQPRKDFKEEAIEELAESIRQYGVLQPLIVHQKGDFYEIIAGERRWRAAKTAGLKEIPVVIREYSQQQSMEIALIENVQRENLNPVEEAEAYQKLIEEFELTQEEVAAKVAKNRATITNSLRLLRLAPEVRKMVVDGSISAGHARALLGIENQAVQIQLAERIVIEKLSVREVEKLVHIMGKPPRRKPKLEEERDNSVIFEELEKRMKSIMGTKVHINKKDKNKGRIEIEYYSSAELERLVELIESIQ